MPRILAPDDNLIFGDDALLYASSFQNGAEPSRLLDVSRGVWWRSGIGWVVTPWNNAVVYSTTTYNYRIGYVVPGVYTTGAAIATAVVTALNEAGLSPIALGASAWWRGDSTSVVNGLITQFTDLTTNANHLVQASAALQFIYAPAGADGRPTGYAPGDAARGYSTVAAASTLFAATTGQHTVFTVFRLDLDAVACRLWHATSLVGGLKVGSAWGGGTAFSAQVRQGGLNFIATKTHATLGAGAWLVHVQRYDGANVSSWVADMDGAGAQNTACTGNLDSNPLSQPFNLGLESSGIKGHIEECIVFPGALSQDQMRFVTWYIRARLPTTYKPNDATTQATPGDTQSGSYNTSLKTFAFATSAAQMTFLLSTGLPVQDRTSQIFEDLGWDPVDQTNTTAVSSNVADSVTSQGRHYIKLDAGASLPAKVLALLDSNLSATGTMTLQGNDLDLWHNPAFSVTITAANRDVWYAYFAQQTLRYWRLVIDDVQNEDGFAELSALHIGSYVEIPAYRNGFADGFDPLSTASYAALGGMRSDERPGKNTFGFAWTAIVKAVRDVFETLRTKIDVGIPFYFAFDEVHAPGNWMYAETIAPVQLPHVEDASQDTDGKFNASLGIREVV